MNELPSDQQVIDATFNLQLAVGAGMIALCVVIHGLGLFTLQRVMRSEAAEERFRHLEPLSFRGAFFTLLVVFALIFIHFVEIWLFAFLYDFVGAQWSFQNALYFSTISYATIGYNDASIAHEWRMVGALEGVLGVILLGWSTAFFVRVLGRIEDTGHARSPPRSLDEEP
ncbi:potassium channel family protein [Tsuneonella sp. YG55]|uniref:Potassium channel family protein n=1 Tax=Tsuneonella litorea TaxID=2976475 RepID=A0A9X2W0Y2_9SPHN|nr:potassium channel family protein [Tsuneonella litorea]MCT2558509.1 potassium channel family protein [Tsuneonella litorea]